MKIAIVTDAIYPYHKGGKERRFYEISTRLVKKGHEVHLYGMKWWDSPEKVRVENGVHLHAISPLYNLYTGKRRSIRQGVMFGLYCFMLMREDWDVIEVDHMPYFPLFSTKIVCLLKGKKMFATWNEVWGRKYWVSYMGFLGNISALIERVSVFLPDYFNTVSPHTSKRLMEIYNIPSRKINSVPPGLDIEAIAALPASPQHFDVVYAGRLWKHKNVSLLIEAIAEVAKTHKSVSCVIIGNGHEKKYLMEQVKDLGLQKNFTFIDFLPHHNDVFSIMKSAKVFVLPSTREGMGMVVLEANASGIPAIVINHEENAAVELIETDNGVVVEFDATAVARAIIDKMEQKDAKEKIAKVVKKYSWDATVSALEEVYQV